MKVYPRACKMLDCRCGLELPNVVGSSQQSFVGILIQCEHSEGRSLSLGRALSWSHKARWDYCWCVLLGLADIPGSLCGFEAFGKNWPQGSNLTPLKQLRHQCSSTSLKSPYFHGSSKAGGYPAQHHSSSVFLFVSSSRKKPPRGKMLKLWIKTSLQILFVGPWHHSSLFLRTPIIPSTTCNHFPEL